MAHFAKLDESNMVIDIVVVNNDVLDPLNEERSGIVFLTELFSGYTNWKQASYNLNFRKNYPGVGYFYDQDRDAFIPPKPFPSWVINEETCNWKPPIEYPNDGKIYLWNEENIEWVEYIE